MGTPLARQYRDTIALAILVVVAAAFVLPSAKAGDWTVTTSLSEAILATDNVDFDVENPIPAVGSSTNIGVSVRAQSYLYDFNLSGSWGYQVYFGENQDVPDPQYIPGLSASYARKGKDLTFIVGGAYSYTPGEDQRGIEIIPGVEPTDPSQPPVDDDVIIRTSDNNADRQIISAFSSVSYKLDNTNKLTWSVKGARIDFFGDNADDSVPSTNAGASFQWLHNRTRRVDLTLSSGVNWYDYENDENQIEYVYSLNGGFTNRVTPRLTVSGSAGVQLLDSYRDETRISPDETVRTHKTDLGGTGSLRLSYRLKTGGLSAGLGYGLTPDEDGELSNALTATIGYSHKINDWSNFRLGVGYQLSDSDVDGVLSNTNFSISPSYNYELTRDWNLGLGYTFTYQNDENGTATENSLNLTLTRSYTILP